MIDSLREILSDLARTPGLSGHEARVRGAIDGWLERSIPGGRRRVDVLGNTWMTLPGAEDAPTVMVFAHMDQLGFMVRRIEADGFLRLERVGGVPERALASQAVVVCGRDGDLPGVIANKSHHATAPEEKYVVTRHADLHVDCGFSSKAEAEEAGVLVGAPVVYRPSFTPLAGTRVAGTSIDDRAGCAALILLAEALARRGDRPTTHIAFTTQEEFNLRGALPLARRLEPDIAIQIDLMLSSDSPDMAGRREVRLGGGPGVGLHSFHGRGTLNGVIPHPALVRLFEESADSVGVSLQRCVQSGVLTDLSYAQHVGHGVAAIDVGFPIRYSHSSLEVCDLSDLAGLVTLLETAVSRLSSGFDPTEGR